jgi:isoleucyl-tRNA synthetase
MKAFASDIATWQAAEIHKIEQSGLITRIFENEQIDILLSEVEISSDDIPGLLVASKGALTVALNIELTDELVKEGLAREFVNKVQKMRKDADFELTDRINVDIENHNILNNALSHYNSYICTEILASSLKFSDSFEHFTEIEVNEHIIKVNITKNV